MGDYRKGQEAYEQGDFESALLEWKPAAEQGEADAQCGLGRLYDNGDGVAFDPDEAMGWFRKAADQGHADAQYRLAERRRRAGSYGPAASWYLKAAREGHAEAQYALGDLYASGDGVQQDHAVSIQARFFLARCYELGEGVTRDVPRAVLMDEKEAGDGCLWSMTTLGDRARLLALGPDLR